ncbi:helix-turn-helix domain-containing protein [Vagococcus sp. BWB3-3]|uniref:Helix-turn-helix domain-containing protein n=1 Tax=Vagococcus allomyrinae TaxID=2794353 RepID=A0A940PBC2_9ENTE|nr:Rgg/GadR/MutR family transcriptional regulator [Vagococcus allomyrinae]MBP1040311.1 helix-turn-helix domain-containing protein [Vagococcus allomyrinae]
MNDNYGEVFRIIRTSQNLTLKEVSTGIVSLSYLGKFETGKTNITLPTFIKLLDRLNIKMDEFIFFCNSSLYNFDELATNISEAYRGNNVTQLLQLKDSEETLFKSTKRKTHQINSIMIAAAIVDLNPSYFISKDDLKVMSDYLLQIPFWSSYNLFVFGCSHAIISPYLLVTLINEIEKLNSHQMIGFSNPRELIFLFHHAAFTFLRNDNLKQAIKAFDYAKELLKSGFFFEKNRSLFLNGLITILQGNTYEGLKMANEAILVIKTLEVSLADKYVLELKRTLEKIRDL